MELKKITKMALITASYVVFSLILAPLSFGPIQIRVAEALCVFALFSLDYSIALTLGCLLTNVIGVMQGVNTLGFVDVILGSVATLISCLLMHVFKNVTYKNVPILSLLMPAVFNGLIIGLEMMLILGKTQSIIIFIEFGLSIMLSELGSMIIFGLPLYFRIKKVNEE